MSSVFIERSHSWSPGRFDNLHGSNSFNHTKETPDYPTNSNLWIDLSEHRNTEIQWPCRIGCYQWFIREQEHITPFQRSSIDGKRQCHPPIPLTIFLQFISGRSFCVETLFRPSIRFWKLRRSLDHFCRSRRIEHGDGTAADGEEVFFSIFDQSFAEWNDGHRSHLHRVPGTNRSSRYSPSDEQLLSDSEKYDRIIQIGTIVLRRYGSGDWRVTVNGNALFPDVSFRSMFRTEWQIYTNGNFYYPRNVSHFLWLYQSSKFLSCNRLLADRMVKQYQLHQNADQWNLTVEPMRYIAQSLDTLEKHYWLAGGTLLGRSNRFSRSTDD